MKKKTPKTTVKSNLNKKTKEQLENIANQLGLKGVKTLTKPKLINKILKESNLKGDFTLPNVAGDSIAMAGDSVAGDKRKHKRSKAKSKSKTKRNKTTETKAKSKSKTKRNKITKAKNKIGKPLNNVVPLNPKIKRKKHKTTTAKPKSKPKGNKKSLSLLSVIKRFEKKEYKLTRDRGIRISGLSRAKIISFTKDGKRKIGIRTVSDTAQNIAKSDIQKYKNKNYYVLPFSAIKENYLNSIRSNINRHLEATGK